MIYVEKTALGTELTERLEREGRQMQVVEPGFIPEDDKKNILITSSANNFVHKCPATSIYRCCGYFVTDAVEGCPFDCSYCILQAYLNHSWIKVYSDLSRMESEIRTLAAEGRRRLGTGELADSLALDGVLGLSEFFVPIVNSLDNIQFELKTKSVQVSRLYNLNPRNVVLSWSLNPSYIAEREEHGAAPVSERIKTAAQMAECGYRLAFHFDPLIMYPGWEEGYRSLIEELTDSIDPAVVEYISISTFRFMPDLAGIVREKHPESLLMRGDFVNGLDGKMRYFKPLRTKMIKMVTEALQSRWKDVFIYYCMEHSTVWEQNFGFDPGERDELEGLFPFYGR
ncbi:SPL family radical SAM protein [Limisalsivibrio acetivorans]|uniref:SPL family radical SAM protein n=1 Tax=Limisalsivibrio acetivorans TaxID=1304888 RepID=UPI0003B5B444|nr:deoxyribodipyrimidine photo-lyase [Limisalsivibrio acetivorans]